MVFYSLSLKGLKFTALLSLPLIGLALVFSLKFAPDFVYDRLISVTFHEKDISRQDRVKAATSSISIFLERPNALITGIGLNNYRMFSWKNKVAHNMFLQMLVEAGLIGFTFFLLLIYKSYQGLWKFTKLTQLELQPFCVAAFSAYTAILVKGLLGDLAYDKYLWLFFILVPILDNIKKKSYAPA